MGEARTGREAVEMVRDLRPDVILMDIAMPVLNGLEATRQILGADPTARVVILSAYSDDEYIERMSAAGVAGFLEKQTSAEILTKAICEVAAGRKFFSPSIARRLSDDRSKPRDRDGLLKANGARLTSREAEVRQLVAEGSANKQAAAELGISIKTVEKHRQHRHPDWADEKKAVTRRPWDDSARGSRRYVFMMFRPAGRLLTGPLPPGVLAARFLAAVIRPPLLFFAMG